MKNRNKKKPKKKIIGNGVTILILAVVMFICKFIEWCADWHSDHHINNEHTK